MTSKLKSMSILDTLSIRIVRDNFIISEDGSVTVGYELTLPIWGEMADSEISTMVSSFKNALRGLPD